MAQHRVGLSLMAAVVLMVAAAPASAQRVPGYHGDYDNASVQFRAWALSEYMETFESWLDAVNAGNVDAAVRHYAADAALELEGSLRGPADIQAGLREWVGNVSNLRAGLADFEASGKLAYGSMRVVISPRDGSGSVTGTLSVLMRQENGTFKIRSQTLLLN